jgi:hypothetical protein
VQKQLRVKIAPLRKKAAAIGELKLSILTLSPLSILLLLMILAGDSDVIYAVVIFLAIAAINILCAIRYIIYKKDSDQEEMASIQSKLDDARIRLALYEKELKSHPGYHET